MAFVAATSANITGAGTKQVAVPGGAAAGMIATIGISLDDGSSIIEDGDFPTDFSPFQAQTNLTHDGQRIRWAWKRLTGADSGNYVFGTISGTSGQIMCWLHSGRHPTDPPEISTAATNNSANTTPVTVTANGVTALAGDDLAFTSTPDVNTTGAGTGHTMTTAGYTERLDIESAFTNMFLATKDNVSAGATGSQVAEFTMSSGTPTSGWAAWTFRYPADPAGSVINEETLSSTIALTDEGLDYTFYNRILESPVTLFDALISVFTGTSIITTTLESAIAVTDGAQLFMLRTRLLQDTIIVSEGTADQFITSNVIADDEIDVTDQLLNFTRYFRLGSDDISVADSLLSTVINYLVVSSVLTSNVTVTDEAMRFAYFTRVLDSFLSVADGEVSSAHRFILLSDALSLDDGAVATYIPGGPVTPATDNPVLKIGFDQPRIDIGGYAVV